MILLQLLWGWRKIVQNEQTQQWDYHPICRARSRMWIRREAMFVYSIKQFNQ